MITSSFSKTSLLSFYGWLDHRLLQDGQMFKNANTKMYEQTAVDSVLGNQFLTYTAPFRSMVWDSSISGATQFTSVSGYLFDPSQYISSGGDQLYSSILFPQIPVTGSGGNTLQFDLSFPAYITIPTGNAVLSGNSVFLSEGMSQTGVVRFSGANSGDYTDLQFVVSGSVTTISGGQYGMQMDYQNGRIIFPVSQISPSYSFSGSYAIRDFNLYFANGGGDKMVFSNKPYLNSRFNRALSGMPPPHQRVTPAIFISTQSLANNPKSLGGGYLYDTEINMKLDVWAETAGQLENVLSLLIDSKDLCFPELTEAQWPLAPSGGLKSAPYSYKALFTGLYTPANLYSITKVRSSKYNDSIALDQSVFGGKVELTLQRTRRLR